MSFRSSAVPRTSRTFGFGRSSTCVPFMWLASWMSDPAAMISISGLAHAASGPHAYGQIRPSPRAFAPIAAGSTPATGEIEPSSPSSPSTVNPETASCGMAPIAAIRPSAIGRSKWLPSFGRSAGAMLTVMRRAGSASPDASSAARTRSRASDTALSGSPTTLNAGSPGATCTCTSTARASMPSNATVDTRWTIATPACPERSKGCIAGARTFAEQTEPG